MLWGISSLATLLLNSAVRALPQGGLGDLLQLDPEVPEVDKPVPVPNQATRHTEQVSTLSRIEHTILRFLSSQRILRNLLQPQLEFLRIQV